MRIPLNSSEKKNLKRVGLRCLFLFLPVILIFFSGCSSDPETITVNLNESFTIGVGQSARITGEDMAITFNEVIGDSRCAKNVTCIWAGVAGSSVTIVNKDQSYSIALNIPGLTDNATQVFFNYTLTYSLDPYPTAGREISPGDYRLTLTVTK